MAICNAQAQEILETDIARHNFFYAGQSKQRRMFIVKDGQIIWSYQDQLGRGEIYYPAHRTDTCGKDLFVNPQTVPAPFHPFETQYDTYLLKYNDIKQ